MTKATAQVTIVMGAVNAKVGKEQMRETSVTNFGTDNGNSPGDIMDGFAERNNVRLMNAFFCKRKKRNWTFRFLGLCETVKVTFTH